MVSNWSGSGVSENGKSAAQIDAAAQVFSQALASAEGVLGDLLKASMSNPMIGVATTCILADLVAYGKVKPQTAELIKLTAFAAAGVAIGSEVLDDISKFVMPSISGAIPSAITPTGQTLVFSEGKDLPAIPVVGKK